MSISPGLYESPPVPPIVIENVDSDFISFTYYYGTVLESEVGSVHAMKGGALVQDCTITGTVTGDQLAPITVDDCTFNGIGMTETGVALVADSDGVITDSSFTGLMYGISRSATGSGDVTVSGCTFSDNAEGVHCGVLGPATGTVDSCTFENNGVGISLGEYCGQFTITGNEFVENGIGIQVAEEVDDCTIFHNNFIDNTQQTLGGDGNVWDDGYPSGGNFWSDHDNSDLFSGPGQDIPGPDGIADLPYQLAGVSALDNYPLASQEAPLVVVGVDIRPGAPGNNINLKSRGQLQVAVLGDPALDVAWIDVASLGIGGVTPVSNPRGIVCVISDVNGDGIADLTVHFRIPDLVGAGVLTSSTTSLELTGNLDQAHNLISIIGTDSVKVK
ncbi:MAG: right-handed parallel beta-helix repeat-containing protein [Methanomassiliicoccales archaeon]|nr:right-handed parallel beta-helix repeat-containing protein [Methanomassiliicoccales archaeon]